MIFSLFTRVNVKLGEETYLFNSERIMFSEVQEIEKLTGLSYMEWRVELNRFTSTACAALLHILRKRAGVASEFATMQFNMADFDVRPVKDDGEEMTPAEMAAELERRRAEAESAPDPTRSAGEEIPAVAPEPSPAATNGTSPSSPGSTASGRGNGKGSAGRSSAGSRLTPTGS